MALSILVTAGGNAAGMKAASRARRLNSCLTITVFEEKAHVSDGACGQSLRSYNASKILKELGLGDAMNLEGGIRMLRWEKDRA